MTTKKVIIKKQEDKYQWSQTDESISIYFPVKNVLLKNIDVVFTAHFLKVNVTSIKFIAVIDFPYEIDYENPKNKI
jgi:hypothetical protein